MRWYPFVAVFAMLLAAPTSAADSFCRLVDAGAYDVESAASVRIGQRRSAAFDEIISAASLRHRVPAPLLRAVIAVESAFDPEARSPQGAIGLMQVMPATGRRFGADDLWNPHTNVDAGARYMRWLMERFDHELPLVLAAYNAGEGAVERHGRRIPPYTETRNYVARVLATLDRECSGGQRYATRHAVAEHGRLASGSPDPVIQARERLPGAGAALLHDLIYGRTGG